MSRLYINNGIIILKNRILKGAAISIDGAKIASVGRLSASRGSRARGQNIIDAEGSFISPGFIDTHIHGDPEDIFLKETKSGVTSIVLALSCGSLDNIYRKIDRVKTLAGKEPFGPNILGLRLEGPYINKLRSGAQNKRYIRNPDAKELSRIIKRCGAALKMMTIAPELDGAQGLIRLLKRCGIAASLGHSNASYEEAVRGIDAGIRHATHIFNAMSPIDRRDAGASGAALLDDRVTAEVIADLVHVNKALFKLLFKTKKRDKIILVTDSVRAEHSRGVKKAGGAYRFKNEKIAGSCLTMIEAVKNAVSAEKLSLAEAVRLATLNPAKFFKVHDKKGTIAAGMDADIVIFDKKFDVKITIVRGEVVYRKKGF